MNQVLTGAGLFCGGVGILYGIAVLVGHGRETERAGPGPSDPDERRGLWAAAGAAVGLALIAACVGLGEAGLFAPGQRLVLGLLLGSVVGAAMCLMLAGFERAMDDALARPGSAPARVRLGLAGAVGLVSAANLGVLATALLWRDDTDHALMGFGMGTVLAVVLASSLLAARGETVHRAGLWSAEIYALYVGALTLTVTLARLHFPSSALLDWYLIPPALSGVAIVVVVAIAPVLTLRSVCANPTGLALLTAVAPAVVAAVALYVLNKRVLDTAGMMTCVGSGIGVAMAMQGYLLSGQDTPSSAESPGGLQATALLGGLVLVAIALCMRVLGAFGVGLGLVALLTVAAPSLALGEGITGTVSPGARSAVRSAAMAAGMGVFFLFYRLFIERFPEVRLIELGVHYNFVAMVIGSLLPGLLCSYAARTRALAAGRGVAVPLGRVGAVGLAVVALPLVLLALWGTKATLGLLVGSLVGLAFVAMLAGAQGSWWRACGGAMPLLVGLGYSSVQLPRAWPQVAALSRQGKVRTAALLAAVLVAWFVVDSWVLGRPETPDRSPDV
ncbi:MAG TPA: hypothetical protein PLD23_08305 [Armatimonadota bacterium]|nr:hypothetical protein [Armatimonadota bacterium]